MKKKKLYFDTSIISYLEQSDTPEKQSATRDFWALAKLGIYDIYLSDVTLGEINDCSEPKRTHMHEWLNDVNFIFVDGCKEIDELVELIQEAKILPPKSKDDCFHIAYAMYYNCDYLLSWNFKHLVNVKTVNGIRAISNLQGYKQLDIVTPEYFISEG